MLAPHCNAPWMRYAGLVESGDPHSGLSINEVVYGAKDCATSTFHRSAEALFRLGALHTAH